jgi:hypothetical protein
MIDNVVSICCACPLLPLCGNVLTKVSQRLSWAMAILQYWDDDWLNDPGVDGPVSNQTNQTAVYVLLCIRFSSFYGQIVDVLLRIR